ncbi:RBR-type E3 ubiquitin transferase [Caerostris extrusa]|uniref:RBR-type E3 ubiquitin transferase n=1 Tax=Caerostris extrusa TaxID=172846 RepID=A0AAV4UPL1_CAEEX|nr:RBR-type E3 ubiquitin transferase [Caerostris extrusa]
MSPSDDIKKFLNRQSCFALKLKPSRPQNQPMFKLRIWPSNQWPLPTDSIFPKQEMSVQTETEAIKNCSVATDPMISSQSMESLLSGMSAPPYHNRRAGMG